MGEMSCRTCGCTDFIRRGDQLICDACGRAYPVEKPYDEEKSKQIFDDFLKARQAYQKSVLDAMWKTPFYTMYNAVMSGKAQMTPDEISRTSEDVIKTIFARLPKEAQPEAYREVGLRTLDLCWFTLGKLQGEWLARQRRYEDIKTDAVHSARIIIFTLRQIVQWFKDVPAAALLAEQGAKVCKVFRGNPLVGCELELEEYARVWKEQLTAQQRAEMETVKAAIADAFWAEHQEEKAALTEKKAQLQKEIAAITKKKGDIAKSNRRTIETMPAAREMAKWDAVVRELQEKQKALSIFRRKEKQALQKEIDAAAAKATGERNKFLYSKQKLEKKTQEAGIRAAAAISVREVLLDKIDRELEKDRFLSGGSCAMMWTHELRQTLTELEETALLDDPFAAGSGKKNR